MRATPTSPDAATASLQPDGSGYYRAASERPDREDGTAGCAAPQACLRELHTEVLIVGGGLGGVAAALAACQLGRQVILTEETDWVGGQLTAQAVPPDEHP